LVAQFGGDAALGCAFQESLHDQVGLVDFFEGVRLFADGDGEGTQTDGAAGEFGDHGFEDALVHFVQPVLVNLEHGERFVGDARGDAAVAADLGVIADATKQVIGDAGRAAAATGDIGRAAV